MSEQAAITDTVRTHFPNVQAVYLFGSHGTERQWPDSDADIALLLPAGEAKRVGNLAMTGLHAALERLLGSAVDLINLRTGVHRVSEGDHCGRTTYLLRRSVRGGRV